MIVNYKILLSQKRFGKHIILLGSNDCFYVERNPVYRLLHLYITLNIINGGKLRFVLLNVFESFKVFIFIVCQAILLLG